VRSAFRGGLGSQPTQYGLGPRPTSVPSGILIRPTVWPQYANVTHRQDRQTGQTGQTGHRCRNIGRTATCNGRPMTSECSSLVIDDKSRVGLHCCIAANQSQRASLTGATHYDKLTHKAGHGMFKVQKVALPACPEFCQMLTDFQTHFILKPGSDVAVVFSYKSCCDTLNPLLNYTVKY